MDVEWADTKITASRSAAVLMTITRLRSVQPTGGRGIQGRARRKHRSRSKQSSNGSRLTRAGFVAVVGGSDAFMHIRQLEAAGHSSLPEGARVKVRIGQGQNILLGDSGGGLLSAEIIWLCDREAEIETELAIDLRTAVEVAIRDLGEIQSLWGTKLARERLLE